MCAQRASCRVSGGPADSAARTCGAASCGRPCRARMAPSRAEAQAAKNGFPSAAGSERRKACSARSGSPAASLAMPRPRSGGGAGHVPQAGRGRQRLLRRLDCLAGPTRERRRLAAPPQALVALGRVAGGLRPAEGFLDLRQAGFWVAQEREHLAAGGTRAPPHRAADAIPVRLDGCAVIPLIMSTGLIGGSSTSASSSRT